MSMLSDKLANGNGQVRGMARTRGQHVEHTPSQWETAAHTLSTEKRLESVSSLWLMGLTPQQIARQLKEQFHLDVHPKMVQRDIATIRAEIATARIATLNDRITESVAKLLNVQQEAWRSYFANGGDKKDKDKAALLNVVMEAQDRINKLEGTDAPERVHAAAIAEVWQVMMDAAALAGGPEFQQYLLGMVQSRMGGSMSGQALGISAPPLADEIESAAYASDISDPESDDGDAETPHDDDDDERMSYTDEDEV